MSKITDILKQVYEPFCAIIAYKAAGAHSSEDMYYLERHNVCADGSLGVGKPLSQSTIVRLFDAVSKTSKELDSSLYGTIPENVIYCDTRLGCEKLVWYRKPEERMMYFSDGLGIPNGRMKIPGLLYVVKGKKLQVLAFKGSKPKSQLFFAPFMNTTENDVCLGNSKVPYPEERTFDNVIAYWEKMFWQSEFSHILGENPCLGNLATITKECIATEKPFPLDKLKPVKIKLSDIIK